MTRVTNNLSITIPIRYKFSFASVQILMKWPFITKNCTAMISWQNRAWSYFILEENVFASIVKYEGNSDDEIAPLVSNVISSMNNTDKSLILGCLWPLVFVLNNALILGIWCSTIPHLPGCFCPGTFFENIGSNTVLKDSFMSHLAAQLGYSAGEFQALQLIVLAAFGVVD